MPARIYRRKHKTIALTNTAGLRLSERLERGNVMRRLWLRLSGGFTSGTTGSNKADLKGGDEWSLISNITLFANGDQVIRSFSGEELQMLNHFLLQPRVLSVGLGNNADSTDERLFDSSLCIPFEMPGARSPMDTALPTHLLSDLRLEVTMAGSTNFDGGGGVHSFTNFQLEVYADESALDPGPFHGCRINRVTQETALTSGQQKNIDLNVGNMYRGFLLHAEDSNSDDVDGIDRIVLRSGMNQLIDIDTEVLRHAYLMRNPGLRPEYTSPAAAADVVEQRPYLSPDTNLAGWYWLDLLDDRLLSELPDTLGLSEFKLECHIDATVQALNVIAVEFIPIRG